MLTIENNRESYPIFIGHTKVTHRHLMSRNNQKPTCGNAACGNQRLTIKHCLQDYPNGGTAEKKHCIKGDIRTLLGKDCGVEKMMRSFGR